MNTKLDGIILSKVKTRLFEPLDNFFSLKAQQIIIEACVATYKQMEPHPILFQLHKKFFEILSPSFGCCSLCESPNMSLKQSPLLL